MEILRNTYLFSAIILGVAGILIQSCNKIEAPNPEEVVLAKIDDLVVTEDHFEAAFKEFYYRTGQAVAPDYRVKKSILDSEFNTYVLATYARDLGLDKTKEADREYGMTTRKVYTEEYRDRELLSQVNVTEADMRELFVRYNTTIRASHLYSRDKVKADSLYSALQQGADFNELARQIFKNPSLANTGGDLGYFEVDELDPAFEIAAHQLKEGEYSKPVKTAHGYSIIKVTSKFVKPIITENEYAVKKQFLSELAYRQKVELFMRAHIEEMEQSIEFDEQALREAWEVISGNYEAFAIGSTELGSRELNRQKLASLNNVEVTVGQLFNETFFNSEGTRSGVVDFESFNKFATALVYRLYLVENAKQQDWIDSYEVTASISETFNNYLAGAAVESLASEITFTEAELYNLYQSEPDKFVHPVELNMARIVVESQSKAEQVINEIRAGLSFREAVRLYTINIEERVYEGVLGMQPATEFGVMAPKLSKLKEGEMSEPIQYSDGEYHIYLCLNKKEMSPMTFPEARDRVATVLKRRKLDQLRAETIELVKAQHNAMVDLEKLKEVEIKI